jgi:L-alanine-DL-glutamate epimerase-like enolase superfamily enzyme
VHCTWHTHTRNIGRHKLQKGHLCRCVLHRYWEDGHVLPPTEPGLGIELDESVAGAHPYTGDGLHLEMQDEPAGD